MKNFTVAVLFGLMFSIVAKADGPVSSREALAIQGYDVVAYFTESKAVAGSSQYATKWNEAVWQFSSDENLQQFKSDPEKYAPLFGGFCTLTVAHGALIPGNPQAWTIRNERLALFFHKPARETWLMNPNPLQERAQINWDVAISALENSKPKE